MRISKIVCDKCGLEIAFKKVIDVGFENNGETVCEFDLCEECFEEVCRFVEGESES